MTDDSKSLRSTSDILFYCILVIQALLIAGKAAGQMPDQTWVDVLSPLIFGSGFFVGTVLYKLISSR